MIKFYTIKKNKIKDRDNDLYISYSSFDRLDSLSYKYYKTPNYWWIILLANNIGSELELSSGDIIRIPFPLEEVLNELSE